MLLTREQVDLHPSEEFHPLPKALLADLESLRQRVASLEAEKRAPKQQLTGSINSRNSSPCSEHIVSTMRSLHGVNLSEGAIASILRRAGEKATIVAEAIKEQIITGEVIRSDERESARQSQKQVSVGLHPNKKANKPFNPCRTWCDSPFSPSVRLQARG